QPRSTLFPYTTLFRSTECSWGARGRWGELEHARDHTHGDTREWHLLGRPPDGSGEPAVWNQQRTKPGQRCNEIGEKHQGPATERSEEHTSELQSLAYL